MNPPGLHAFQWLAWRTLGKLAGIVSGIEADAFIEGAIWLVPLALMAWLAVASWRDRGEAPQQRKP
jgi:threonine/homoserine/homoserine lactone efflux protein